MNLAMKVSLFVEVLVHLDSPGLILTLIPDFKQQLCEKSCTFFFQIFLSFYFSDEAMLSSAER